VNSMGGDRGGVSRGQPVHMHSSSPSMATSKHLLMGGGKPALSTAQPQAPRLRATDADFEVPLCFIAA
jgi:hypothetical protein